MKSLIQIVLVALVIGGVSAAGSLYWKQWIGLVAPAVTQSESEAASETEGEAALSTHEADSKHENAGVHTPTSPHAAPPEPAGILPTMAEQSAESTYVPPVAARPPYIPEGDEAGHLIAELRSRARTVSDAEQRLAERQESLKLIFDDLRSEQAAATKLRHRILDELGESSRLVDASLESRRADDAALRAAREEQESLKKQLDTLRQSAAELDSLKKQLDTQRQSALKGSDAADVTDVSGSMEENANLKKLAAIYDVMPPENTAKIFQQLVKSNKSAAVVALLNAMKERQTSKVLTLVSEADPILAADLTERLKRLKTAPVPTSAK